MRFIHTLPYLNMCMHKRLSNQSYQFVGQWLKRECALYVFEIDKYVVHSYGMQNEDMLISTTAAGTHPRNTLVSLVYELCV